MNPLPVRYIGGLPRRRIGATPPFLPAFTQAQTDLQNQVSLPITAGDTYLASLETANALSAYQAAGQAGATSVGPEIDLAGMANVTQQYTQQAWVINGFLAKESDATKAQGYVKMMQALYEQAIAAAADTYASAKGDLAKANTAGSVGTPSIVFGTLFAGTIAGIAWVAYHR